jgi:hypothetical protein
MVAVAQVVIPVAWVWYVAEPDGRATNAMPPDMAKASSAFILLSTVIVAISYDNLFL